MMSSGFYDWRLASLAKANLFEQKTQYRKLRTGSYAFAKRPVNVTEDHRNVRDLYRRIFQNHSQNKFSDSVLPWKSFPRMRAITEPASP
jgi:hypothetical protein